MESDWEKYGLKGSVKSVIVEIARFEWQAGQLTEQPWSRETMTFNQDGCLTEQTTHNSNGFESRIVRVVNRQTFSYDEAGYKAEEVSYNEHSPGGSKEIFTRDYDEHGNWTKELFSTVSSWDAEFGLSTPVHVTRRTIT